MSFRMLCGSSLGILCNQFRPSEFTGSVPSPKYYAVCRHLVLVSPFVKCFSGFSLVSISMYHNNWRHEMVSTSINNQWANYLLGNAEANTSSRLTFIVGGC
jgi:hypothetical protein